MRLFEKRKVKGAISIFLVMILIPVMLFSAVLIDGSRMASAKAITQEAADLAAASALADYHQKLKEEFGLFALNDPEKLEEIYKESLSATLVAYGLSENADYSARIWDIMKTTLSGSKSYMGESFLNLYDFSVDQCSVEPLYPLAELNVLESQMVEYAKFRGIYVIGDRMDIFSNLSVMQAQAEENRTTSEVMEKKMDVDEDNAKADEKLSELREELTKLNGAITLVKATKENYLTALRGRMEQIRIENTDTEDELSDGDEKAAALYTENRKYFSDAAKEACKQAKAVLKDAEDAKKEVEKAIQSLERFRVENQGKASGNESVSSLLNDAEDNIRVYREEYLPAIQALLDDPVLAKMKEDTGIDKKLDREMDKIDDAITEYIEVIEELREAMEEESEDDSEDDEEEEEILDYYYYYLNNQGSTTDAHMAVERSSGGYRAAVSALTKYFEEKSWDSEKLNPSNRFANKSSTKINQDFAKEQSGKTGDSGTNREGEAQQGEIEQGTYESRPSKTYSSESGKNNNTDFYKESNNLDSSKNILSQGGQSMILDLAETMRDDVLGLSYLFGTFKTRMTGVEKFSSDGMAKTEKDNYYMPKWRYAYPDGELDMRFEPKKDRNTVLRSEIEYLIYGNRTDWANEAAVYTTIFAERLANNLLVMYAEKKVINPACHTAAGAASLAVGGVVPEPVFFWIFLTAWATAETLIEMEYLISYGYKIPLIKTTDNILLNEIPSASGDGLISNYGAEQKKTVLVSYEDYLLILLLIKGKEKRISRAADLIEFNMKKNGAGDFTMAKAYTWLHADTKLSIRFLFGGEMPFQPHYEEKGFSGRMSFTNTIYQGY